MFIIEFQIQTTNGPIERNNASSIVFPALNPTQIAHKNGTYTAQIQKPKQFDQVCI